MSTLRAKQITLVLVTAMIAGSAAAVAQTQNQSIWQRIKNSAKQTEQNTAQQGTQQVQQGIGAVGNQMNGTQTPCGSFGNAATNSAGGTLTNAAFNGGGGSTGNYATGSCGQNCFNAGPFAAAVSQMTMSQQGPWHIIRMEVQFHNATNQPLAIAYHDGSMVMVDELGNTYQGAGGNPGEVQGMGIDRGGQTDSQFVLSPGQTSSAMFSVARYRANTSAIGSAFNYNFTIDELQAQNGAQAIVARQYNLNFPNLAPGTAGGAFPSATPANGFVGGANNSGGVANYVTPSSGAVNNSSRTAPNSGASLGQRAAVTARSRIAAVPPPSNRAPAQGVVSNAALRSTAVTAVKPAGNAKPSPVKSTPAKSAVNKSSDTN